MTTYQGAIPRRSARSSVDDKRRSAIRGAFLTEFIDIRHYCRAHLLYTLTNSAGRPLPEIILLVCVLAILVTAPWGVIITYINERFATEVRATGFGIGFSLSVVLPSFYAFYLNGLGYLVPPHAAPAALLFIGGVIATVGAAMGPETRDVDF